MDTKKEKNIEVRYIGLIRLRHRQQSSYISAVDNNSLFA